MHSIEREVLLKAQNPILVKIAPIINKVKAEIAAEKASAVRESKALENSDWLSELDQIVLLESSKRSTIQGKSAVGHFKVMAERHSHSVDNTRRKGLRYYRMQREILANSTIRNLIRKYKESKSSKDRKALLIFLDRDYRRVLTSLDDFIISRLPKSSLQPIQDKANIVGMGTGEIFSAVQQTIPISWLNIIGYKLRDICPPLSYFFYGIAAMIGGVRKLRKLLKTKERADPNLLPPRVYVKTTIFSAVANFAVCGLYAGVAVFLFSLIPSEYLFFPANYWSPLMGDATYAIAMQYAAIGTALGWIGNNIIDTWRLNKEYNEIGNLNSQFDDSTTFRYFSDQLKESATEEWSRLFLGFFMVAGMVLLALNCVIPTPNMPMLDNLIEMSVLKTAYISCFIIYASKEIWKGIKYIGNCFICNQDANQPSDTSGLQSPVEHDRALSPDAGQSPSQSPLSFSSSFEGSTLGSPSQSGLYSPKSSRCLGVKTHSEEVRVQPSVSPVR